MSGGRNRLFPRSAVPKDVGRRIRAARQEREWTQQRLAERAGVERRTIMRLEKDRHVPSSPLIHALERVLGFGERGLVAGWTEPARPHEVGAWGPRARLARRFVGLTLATLAKAAGVSAATISRFEREMGDTPLILQDAERGHVGNAQYAAALGFNGTQMMTDFLRSKDPSAWLRLKHPAASS